MCHTSACQLNSAFHFRMILLFLIFLYTYMESWLKVTKMNKKCVSLCVCVCVKNAGNEKLNKMWRILCGFGLVRVWARSNNLIDVFVHYDTRGFFFYRYSLIPCHQLLRSACLYVITVAYIFYCYNFFKSI